MLAHDGLDTLDLFAFLGQLEAANVHQGAVAHRALQALEAGAR
jgi:hypothetical protein